MKRNKEFAVTNLFWPGLFVFALLVAALASNFSLFKSMGARGFEAIPTPAPPIQMSAGAAPAAGAAAADPAAVQSGVNQVLARVLPSVVSITRSGPGGGRRGAGGVTYLAPSGGPSESTGSGVIVDARGYVLTTFQTVGRASVAKVSMLAGTQREYLADVVGVDAGSDLALLKIRSSRVFTAAVLGDSDRCQVGDIIFAVGNPFGFNGTVTMGIVSSNDRKINIGGIRYPDLIQTDAAVNEGNDGGPLVNINGEVIGINMACLMPDHKYSGIGFAAPINSAADLLAGQAP
ncbi:MAG: trypsin-like peptidase domain-containing protein [Desulfovibrionaceae bacterium]|nr:trypsin-like peptidase domain-containing protein [Desulfovibrionaceae bacterium]MBF0515254.1 trypsin-like peptidase domain-containing protein [Desulfovibrionaceae bacterium]